MTAIPRPGTTLEKMPEALRALVVVEDDETRTVFGEALDEAGLEVRSESGGIAVTVEYLEGGAACPPLIVVDVENSNDPLADIDALAEVCNPGTSVLAVGKANDVNLFRDLVACGVADYLVKPCREEHVRTAVANALRPPESATDKELGKPGRMVVVVGSRGGVGASTVALNAAWILAQRPDQKIALVDLDLYFGTSTFTLDLEPGRGLRDALEHPDRVDSLFISSIAVPAHERLHIFGAEEPIENGFEFDAHALDILMTELRHDFRTVVVDLPRHFLTTPPELISMADLIVFVTDMTLSGMRDTMRLVSAMKSIAPQVDSKVVVNRMPQGRKGPINRTDFEKGIEHAIDCVIPEDVKSVSVAANVGRPLAVAAKKSKTVMALRSLCDDIAGTPPKRKRSALLRLLGRK
ncbi:MAG: response regulator/pilus assembly protein [Alphaproteobacteria bacterium]|nr:response regulator/pilus assembly protein [Alphaproteobacteria bacterium]